jgi:hypothetical protein
MAIVWRGVWADHPAQTFARPACERLQYDDGQGGEIARWTLSGIARPIVLDPLRGRQWSSCAVSADGGRLALIVPPFVHLYDIAAQPR